MSRFKFSERILTKFPNKSDMNSIKDDFESYINDSKIPADNVSDESVRFRHLAKSPTIIVYRNPVQEIYEAGTVGSPGSTSQFYSRTTTGFKPYRTVYPDSTDDKCALKFNYEGSGVSGKVIELTIIYKPYNIHPKTQVCIMYHIKGADEDDWVAIEATKKSIGMKAGFSSPWDMTPYNPGYSTGSTGLGGFYRHRHPILHPINNSIYNKTTKRNVDVIKTVAYGGRVVLQRQFGTEGVHGIPLDKIDAFRMGIKFDASTYSFNTGDTMPDVPWESSLRDWGKTVHAPGKLNGYQSPYDDYTIMIIARDY